MKFALLALLMGCTGPSADAPVSEPAWGAERPTQLRRYLVSLEFTPADPPMGELFEVVAHVKARDGTVLEDCVVKLDARMPDHGHGMETKPIDDPGVCPPTGTPGPCKHAGGVYTTTGFKFHMPGRWAVTVDVSGSEGIDSTAFDYEMAP
jgi:hypothetical protein